MTTGDPLGPDVGDQASSLARSMLPLKGWRLRGRALVDDQVDRLGAGVLDVGAGRVEVGVVGDDLALAAERARRGSLAGPALVGRQDVLEAGDALERSSKG
jgi:hypothetical protein